MDPTWECDKLDCKKSLDEILDKTKEYETKRTCIPIYLLDKHAQKIRIRECKKIL
jgi:hypothetical protein